MCLVFNEGDEVVVKVATRDIKTYKILFKYDGSPVLVSPYMSTPYVLKQEYAIPEDDWLQAKQTAAQKYAVSEGALHSYQRLKDATDSGWGGRVYEAIIPKGSEYMDGRYGERVSNKLIVQRLYRKKRATAKKVARKRK